MNYQQKDGIISSLVKNRSLIVNLVKRDVAVKYKGSMLGILWSVLTPILMLAVYTFVFSIVFNIKWDGAQSDSKGEFALLLFAGLLVFNYFAEVTTRAPMLILTHSNYVKKVIFPLEVLSWVNVLSALYGMMMSLLVWFIFYFIEFGVPHFSVIELPLVLLPLIFLTVGISWLLSALGVYLRDIGQLIGIIVTMVMFLSPIFYPISAIPEEYRDVLKLNPIAPIIANIREVLFYGHSIISLDYFMYLFATIIFAVISFFFFQKTRKGFADVL